MRRMGKCDPSFDASRRAESNGGGAESIRVMGFAGIAKNRSNSGFFEDRIVKEGSNTALKSVGAEPRSRSRSHPILVIIGAETAE